ncbi:MAG: glycosyltransferase [Bacteroidales bacterium]|jgi:GT2 family glycosyltransferase|nr:glycosyltransferase [Bacteroidales bacterium]
MCKLSIIIVNYNVQYFLEQCLHSVYQALENIDSEVWVVDNNSVDGSVAMVKEKFPQVKLIDNEENLGFSKANNQAIRLSKGEYVLLLNPDTLVEVDTFEKVVDFMDSHPEAGGLGVKMVDGKGRFLPESKRGLPTPAVAFYKIFGLAKLFPKSKKFGQYHLTFLDDDEIHDVDVLSGAFMLMRKETLDKVGLLDEDFFMYGEDIDLSYRIQKGGYRNYYFPETRIIHYKGESTKKGSLNYVFVFYNAMIIFAQKHFSQSNAKLFSFFIKLAIYLRASLSIIKRFVQRTWQAVVDALVLYAGMFFLSIYWEQNVMISNNSTFPKSYLLYIIPSYILIWILSFWFTDLYEKRARTSNLVKGVFVGTIAILVIYALMPESLRFSRAMIVLGAVWGVISLTSYRFILNLLGAKTFNFGDVSSKRFLVVGQKDEAERVAAILRNTSLTPNFLGIVTPEKSDSEDVIGYLSQIEDIIEIYQINEIVFCAQDVASNVIIDLMSKLHKKDLDFKIAPPESLSIIGSNSINTSGDIYLVGINSVSLPKNRRKKRFFDFVFSFIIILFLPFLIPFNWRVDLLLSNIFSVIFGRKTWVGINPDGVNMEFFSPKKAVIYSTDNLKIQNFSKDIIEKANQAYSQDYKISKDFFIILRNLNLLSRKN